jgi:hypothetical protein
MADKGTVVVTEETFGTVKKVGFAWTSGIDADAGLATKTTTNPYSGKIERLVTVPDTAGDQPDNLYDVVLNDEDDTDVLMGAGANRSNAATEQVLATSLGIVANDKLTLSISNAGAAKKGTTYVYIR